MLALVLASLISGAQGTENACQASLSPVTNFGENSEMWGFGCAYCTDHASDMSQPNCQHVVQASSPSINGCGTSFATLPQALPSEQTKVLYDTS